LRKKESIKNEIQDRSNTIKGRKDPVSKGNLQKTKSLEKTDIIKDEENNRSP